MLPVQGLRRSVGKSLRTGVLAFSTSSPVRENRAIFYETTGNPSQVLRALTYPSLSPPPAGSVNIRFLLSPINPSDLNVVEGVYPSKPTGTRSLAKGHTLKKTVYVPGNEGVAEVMDVGPDVVGLNQGDRVVMSAQQGGTWASARTVAAGDVIKVPNNLSEVNAATVSVNTATAYNMLHEFVDLRRGDWVIQNAANSAVGQAVIQIAHFNFWKTINFVRNRKDIQALKEQLYELGATHVLTYDDLEDRSLRDKVKEWTGGKPIRLMLNGVGGQPTTLMTRYLGTDAHLVTYGGMSKQPLSIPTSSFIFKNLVTHGFWQSRWYTEKSREERERLMEVLADMNLQEPAHEILTLSEMDTDEIVGAKVRWVIQCINEGNFGKKILLRIEEPAS